MFLCVFAQAHYNQKCANNSFSSSFAENYIEEKEALENRGIDPRTSRMLSERSTIWASSPVYTELLNSSSTPNDLSLN